MKIKKTLITLLTLCLIMSTLIGCSSSNKTKSGKKRTKFTLGFDAEFPPYGYRDEETGEYVGFDIDLAKEVCNITANRLGFKRYGT